MNTKNTVIAHTRHIDINNPPIAPTAPFEPLTLIVNGAAFQISIEYDLDASRWFTMIGESVDVGDGSTDIEYWGSGDPKFRSAHDAYLAAVSAILHTVATSDID